MEFGYFTSQSGVEVTWPDGSVTHYEPSVVRGHQREFRRWLAATGEKMLVRTDASASVRGAYPKYTVLATPSQEARGHVVSG